MYGMRFRKKDYMICLSVIIYRILSEITYVQYLYPKYAYSGFQFSFSPVTYTISWIMLLLFIMPFIQWFKDVTLSGLTMIILFLLGYVPFTAYTGLTDNKSSGLVFLYWSCLFLFNYVVKLPYIKCKKIKLNKFVISGIMIFCGGAVIFIWANYAKFNIQTSLTDVYTLRFASRQYAIPSLLKYVFTASKKAIPVFIVFLLSKRRWIAAYAFALIQILGFFCDGSKGAIALLIVSIGAYMLLKNRFDNAVILLPYGMAGLSLVVYLECIFTQSGAAIMSYFTRRTLFVPQQLNDWYYDYFSKNGFDYFAQGFLKRFGAVSKHELRLASLIGKVYGGNENISANNGLFSDAYSNLGVIGCIIMPLIIILFLKFMEKCAKGLPKEIFIAPAVSTATTLISTTFTTGLLTHGLLAICLMLYVIPRQNQKYIKDQKMDRTHRNLCMNSPMKNSLKIT